MLDFIEKNFTDEGIMFGYVQSYASKDKNLKNYIQIMVDQAKVDAFDLNLQKVHFYKFESLLPLIRKYEALMKMDTFSFSKMIIKPFNNTKIVEPSHQIQEYLKSNEG